MNVLKYPKFIHWGYFTDWGNNSKILNLQAACYALVYNETKPEPHKLPYEFEECVYIGETAGRYIDTLGGRAKVRHRTFLHSRLGQHFVGIVSGNTQTSSHKKITDIYGIGKQAADGVVTGKPLWLAIIAPRDEVKFPKAWAQMMERDLLFEYLCRWNKAPLGNLDCRIEQDRIVGSKSNQLTQDMKTLDYFLEEAN